jgi:ABC-2 type transport system ATP-binding protein
MTITAAHSEPLTNRVSSRQPVAIASIVAVDKSYGRQPALRNFSFSIHAGEVVALLGPNGAGKTTAVKLLLGLLEPDSGQVEVFGRNPRSPQNRVRTGAMMQVGRMPETLKVREHIDLFSSYYPKPLSMAETLAASGLRGYENRYLGKLSGGEKQRLMFALALCGDPDLIILDEPTVGLDVESRRGLWLQIRRLAERGKSVLITTHYLDEADALAHRIVVMNRGGVIATGTPADIKAHAATKRIRCSTILNLPTVQALRGVSSATQTEHFMEIQASNSDQVLAQLLQLDPQLSDIEISSAALEDAFLALTQGNSN